MDTGYTNPPNKYSKIICFQLCALRKKPCHDFCKAFFELKLRSVLSEMYQKSQRAKMDFIVKESLRAVSFCLHCFGCLERFNILSSCFNLSVFIVLAEKIWFKEIPADLPFPTSFPFQTCLPETMDLKDAILTQQKCTRHCWKLTSEAES